MTGHDRDVHRFARCRDCGGYEPVCVHPDATRDAILCSGCGDDDFHSATIVQSPRCAYCSARAVTSVGGDPRCVTHESAAARAEVDSAAE